jgi:hypothetical protein
MVWIPADLMDMVDGTPRRLNLCCGNVWGYVSAEGGSVNVQVGGHVPSSSTLNPVLRSLASRILQTRPRVLIGRSLALFASLVGR